MKSFEYIIPSTVDEALRVIGDQNAVVKASGIDLLDLMKEGLVRPDRLVYVRELKELAGIRKSDGLHIGPAVTLAELASHDLLKSGYRALAQAADAAATPQIRNSATLGGNLCQRPRCWYFRSADFNCLRKGGSQCFAYEGENQYHAIFGNKDGCAIVHPSATAVALLALDAKLTIRSTGKSRDVAMEDFFIAPANDPTRENILEPGELIAGVHIPEMKSGRVSHYLKQKEKQSFDWPIAEVAVAMTLSGGVCSDSRIVMGAAAPVPWRARSAESILNGKTVTVEQAKAVASEAVREATPLADNGYKVTVFRAAIMRTICLAAGIDPYKKS